MVASRTESVALTNTMQVPTEIAAAQGVDEVLFLVRLLENVYDEANYVWMRFGAGLECEMIDDSVKDELYVARRNLDQAATSLFADLVATMRGNVELAEELLPTFKAIRQSHESAWHTALMQSVQRVFGGGQTGWGDLVHWWETFGQANKASESSEAQIKQSIRRFETQVEPINARIKSLVIELAERHRWKRGEFGWDLPLEQEQQIRQATASGDVVTVLPLLDRIRRRRPRDPFAEKRYLQAAACQTDLSARELEDIASALRKAVRLIPNNEIYDPIRADYLQIAGAVAVQACVKQCDGQAWSSTALSAFAVHTYEARDEYAPFQVELAVQTGYAAALAMDGQFEAALRVLDQLQPGDGTQLLFFRAQLLSRLDRPTESLACLKQLFAEQAVCNLRSIRDDPQLANLRHCLPEQFDELTAATTQYCYDWGIFYDDLVITNDSCFPLTNVVVRGRVRGTTGMTADLDLRVEQIGSRQTHRWEWVASVGEPKSLKLTLSCDQAESIRLA
jgi:tetratricopeptide (TPR) repeat protein